MQQLNVPEVYLHAVVVAEEVAVGRNVVGADVVGAEERETPWHADGLLHHAAAEGEEEEDKVGLWSTTQRNARNRT